MAPSAPPGSAGRALAVPCHYTCHSLLRSHCVTVSAVSHRPWGLAVPQCQWPGVACRPCSHRGCSDTARATAASAAGRSASAGASAVPRRRVWATTLSPQKFWAKTTASRLGHCKTASAAGSKFQTAPCQWHESLSARTLRPCVAFAVLALTRLVWVFCLNGALQCSPKLELATQQAWPKRHWTWERSFPWCGTPPLSSRECLAFFTLPARPHPECAPL